MPKDIEASVDDLMNAFEEFKATNDENQKKRDVVLDEKLDRLNNRLNSFEAVNQKITTQEQQAKAADDARKEMQEQLDRIETKLNRPGSHSGNSADINSDNVIFWDFLRYDVARVNQMHDAGRIKNVLTLSDDTGGGYLAPSTAVPEIIKGATEFSPMREHVRVRQTSQKSVPLPKRTGLLVASMVGEIEERGESQGQSYGLDDVPTHEMTAELYYSMAQLEDSAFDMEAEFVSDTTEAFAVKEGQQIVAGNGSSKQLQGFLNASGTIQVGSGNATKITADGIIDLKYAIKTAYARNGLFCLNRTSLGAIRKLKDGEGNYLWTPGLAQGRPNTIDGDPYCECPDMPNQAAGAKVMAYGDFRRGYTLIDRLAIAVVRDGLTRASVGQVKMVARRRLGGQVVLPEAIAIMTCSA